jgi:hypothetical protein
MFLEKSNKMRRAKETEENIKNMKICICVISSLLFGYCPLSFL